MLFRSVAAGVAAAICLAVGLGALERATLGIQGAGDGQPPDQVAQPSPKPEPSAAARAKVVERLSRSFAQRARGLLQRDKVYIGLLDSAEALLQVSIELAPDNPQIWRIALDLATTMEDGDPSAAELSTQSLRRLNELEPANEMIRLRRIVDSVSRRQTVEERLAAYERLLAPESVAKIGNAVAARLAFDAAILRRRSGDIAGFEQIGRAHV